MKTVTRFLCTAGLVLTALVAWGQIPQYITVPSGKGWYAALSNAGLPAIPQNVAILQERYGNPHPTTYALPGGITATNRSISNARQAPSAQSQIVYPKNQHVVESGESFSSIAKRYYGNTLSFVPEQHRAEKLAQYAVTIAYINKYHDGSDYSRQLQVGDTLSLPPANPLVFYDQDDYVIGYGHWLLLGDTVWGVEHKWYSEMIQFRFTNYNHLRTGEEICDLAVGSILTFDGNLSPRLEWVQQSGVRHDYLTGR